MEYIVETLFVVVVTKQCTFELNKYLKFSVLGAIACGTIRIKMLIILWYKSGVKCSIQDGQPNKCQHFSLPEY